jgi:hypothetical protein
MTLNGVLLYIRVSSNKKKYNKHVILSTVDWY